MDNKYIDLEKIIEKDFELLQKEYFIIPDNDIGPYKLGYIKGVIHQTKISYSEQDVLDILEAHKSSLEFYGKNFNQDQWFEQFKKK
jgi:hypothetical protein